MVLKVAINSVTESPCMNGSHRNQGLDRSRQPLKSMIWSKTPGINKLPKLGSLSKNLYRIIG